MANNKNRFSCLKEDLQESDNLDKSNSRRNIFTNPSNLPINSRWQRSPDSPKSNTFKKKYGHRRREDDRGTKERGRNNYRNNNYHLGRNKGRNTTNITGKNIGEFNLGLVLEKQKKKSKKKLDKKETSPTSSKKKSPIQNNNNFKILSSKKDRKEDNCFKTTTDKNIRKSILSQYQYYSDEDVSYHDDDYYDPRERDLIDKILEQQCGE